MAASQESLNAGKNVRQRRAHRKSRSGCVNCKLRRVKCDEGLPECSKCLSFRVCCNYDIRIPDLQPQYAISRKLNGKMQTYSALVTDLTSVEESKLELTERNLSRLERFQIRTVLSLGPPELRQLYENEVYRLTLRHPFLMYFAQTLTSIHDRYLSPIPSRRTIEEIHYWTKGVTLFNQKLSAPLPPADRDAIWAAATMLGVITFASIEVPMPEESWPLVPSMTTEPEWLKMGNGKSALWRLVKPDRPDSIFHTLFSALPTVEFSLENVPPGFMKLYKLDGLSADSSPYAIPIISIFAPRNMECPSSAIALFYVFNSCMHNEFGLLVLNKDPRALLVMAYWYSKICTGQWWLRRRALMEGRATCMYLERYCAHNVTIQDLLKVPRQYLFKSAL
ncbi:hypothetical protein V1519DRAFT_452976 [Lipomyces tetrasporus]